MKFNAYDIFIIAWHILGVVALVIAVKYASADKDIISLLLLILGFLCFIHGDFLELIGISRRKNGKLG